MIRDEEYYKRYENTIWEKGEIPEKGERDYDAFIYWTLKRKNKGNPMVGVTLLESLTKEQSTELLGFLKNNLSGINFVIYNWEKYGKV